MPLYKVVVTRDCAMTQSATQYVNALDHLEAEAEACRNADDGKAIWNDDDSFHTGPAYVADPGLVHEVNLGEDEPAVKVSFSVTAPAWVDVHGLSDAILDYLASEGTPLGKTGVPFLILPQPAPEEGERL